MTSNPELRDPERVHRSPRGAVVAKAETIEQNLRSAIDNLADLQILMASVPNSSISPQLAGQVSELRIAAAQASQYLTNISIYPLLIRAIYQERDA